MSDDLISRAGAEGFRARYGKTYHSPTLRFFLCLSRPSFLSATPLDGYNAPEELGEARALSTISEFVLR